MKTFGFYWDLVIEKVKTGKLGNPVAVQTGFGWILNGPVANKSVDSSTKINISESHILYLDLALQQSFNGIDKK